MSYAVSLIVKVTDQCNLNCPYCYYYAGSAVDLRKRKFKDAEQRLIALSDAIIGSTYINNAGRVTLVIHGGEPLLVPRPVMAAFIEPLRAHFGDDLNISLQTNGVLLDEAWLDFLIEHVVSTSVSIDGPEDVHDRNRPHANGAASYVGAKRAIALLKSDRAVAALGEPAVLAVYTPGVSGKAYFRSIVEDLDVQVFDLLFPDDAFTNKETLPAVVDAFDQTIRDIWSAWLALDDPRIQIRFIQNSLFAVARTRPAFNPDVQRPIVVDLKGDIFIEDGLRASVDYKDLTVGNWLQDGFDLMMDRLEAAARKAAETPVGCGGCSDLARCRGGDITNRLMLPDGAFGVSPLCSVYKTGFDLARRVLPKRPEPSVASEAQIEVAA